VVVVVVVVVEDNSHKYEGISISGGCRRPKNVSTTDHRP
jgi:hypothetical protein